MQRIALVMSIVGGMAYAPYALLCGRPLLAILAWFATACMCLAALLSPEWFASDETPYTRRHRRMQQNGGYHTEKEWRVVCAAYNWRCAACKKRRPLTKDHIIAVVQGGTNDITNIQPLCRSCNSKKG
jgi:hypothetical protein